VLVAVYTESRVTVADARLAVLAAERLAGVVIIAQQPLDAVTDVAARFTHIEDAGQLTLSGDESSIANRIDAVAIGEALGAEIIFRIAKRLFLSEEEDTLAILPALYAVALVGVADQAMFDASDV